MVCDAIDFGSSCSISALGLVGRRVVGDKKRGLSSLMVCRQVFALIVEIVVGAVWTLVSRSLLGGAAAVSLQARQRAPLCRSLRPLWR